LSLITMSDEWYCTFRMCPLGPRALLVALLAGGTIGRHCSLVLFSVSSRGCVFVVEFKSSDLIQSLFAPTREGSLYS
jgi:hypothetical protein